MLLLMASSLSTYVPSPDFLTVDDSPPNVHPSEVSRRSLSLSAMDQCCPAHPSEPHRAASHHYCSLTQGTANADVIESVLCRSGDGSRE
jgi:hypothetical protein